MTMLRSRHCPGGGKGKKEEKRLHVFFRPMRAISNRYTGTYWLTTVGGGPIRIRHIIAIERQESDVAIMPLCTTGLARQSGMHPGGKTVQHRNTHQGLWREAEMTMAGQEWLQICNASSVNSCATFGF